LAVADAFVTAAIRGRLGNSLFQVATASALAWDNDAHPCFPALARRAEHARHVFFRCDLGHPGREPAFVWNEPVHSYTPIPYRPDMHVNGYFQSERYFAHHRERLLALFEPGPEDLERIRSRYGLVLDHPRSVGVQIRYFRGEDRTGAMFPQLGHEYLERAASFFPSDSLFVVSSNHPRFALASLPDSMEQVALLEDEPDYLDLFVLSRCRDIVITNSSFGWWAAWLNRNPGKVVVRPELWLEGLPTHDTCPDEWISIDAPPI
jgi:hypothetical protein